MNSTAPSCSGRVYGCDRCGKNEMTINESFAHADECPAALPFVLKSSKYTHVSPRVNAEGDVLCPCCGKDDLAMWADDGEADLADWWECQTYGGGCGEGGAVMSRDDRTRTQNGVAV